MTDDLHAELVAAVDELVGAVEALGKQLDGEKA